MFLELSIVVSSSMHPTLQGTSYASGDWLVTERVSYWFRDPGRWEVVTYRADDGVLVSKRVVRLPGETIALSQARPVIDGRTLSTPDQAPFVRYFPFGSLRQGREIGIGNGYFVLGDDSKDSQDSRFEGEVKVDRILGRAWLIVWPPERVGFVHR